LIDFLLPLQPRSNVCIAVGWGAFFVSSFGFLALVFFHRVTTGPLAFPPAA
jgi:hypothetical protein